MHLKRRCSVEEFDIYFWRFEQNQKPFEVKLPLAKEELSLKVDFLVMSARKNQSKVQNTYCLHIDSFLHDEKNILLNFLLL